MIVRRHRKTRRRGTASRSLLLFLFLFFLLPLLAALHLILLSTARFQPISGSGSGSRPSVVESPRVAGSSCEDDALRLHYLRELRPRCGTLWAEEGRGGNVTVALAHHYRRISRVWASSSPLSSSSPRSSASQQQQQPWPEWWTYDDVLRAQLNPATAARVDSPGVCPSAFLEHSARDSEHSARNSVHSARDSEHSARDSVHSARDSVHSARDSEHSARNSVHSARDSVGSVVPCDALSVPFDAAADDDCMRFAASLLAAAFAQPAATTITITTTIRGKIKTVRGAQEWRVEIAPRASVAIRALAPSYEQRTAKFAATLCAAPGHCAEFIVKVPQRLFPREPFAEVAAFAVDRRLRVHRVPPTFLAPIALTALRTAAAAGAVSIGPAYAAFVERDVFDFIEKTKTTTTTHAELRAEGGFLWASVQLRIADVAPLLRGPLRVPYSKRTPGWHRWFSPLYNDSVRPVPLGQLAALAQMAMVDYIIGNNDRSPNKNAFVAGKYEAGGALQTVENAKVDAHAEAEAEADGREKKIVRKWNQTARRPLGCVPTLLHVDNGLAFAGGSLVHNPLAKPPERATFCMFYRPLALRLLRIEREEFTNGERYGARICRADVHRDAAAIKTERQERSDEWAKYLAANVTPVALRALGGAAVFRKCGDRMVRLLERLEMCLGLFPPEVVLIP